MRECALKRAATSLRRGAVVRLMRNEAHKGQPARDDWESLSWTVRPEHGEHGAATPAVRQTHLGSHGPACGNVTRPSFVRRYLRSAQAAINGLPLIGGWGGTASDALVPELDHVAASVELDSDVRIGVMPP
jgi:hypothetical protein